MRKLALYASIAALLALVGCGGGTKDGEASSGIGVKTAAVWKRPEGLVLLIKPRYGPPAVRVYDWNTGELVENLGFQNYTGGYSPSALSKDRRYAVRKGQQGDLWLYEAERSTGYVQAATVRAASVGYSSGAVEYDKPRFHPKTGRLWFEANVENGQDYLVSVDPANPSEEPRQEVARLAGYPITWGFDQNGDVFQVDPGSPPQAITARDGSHTVEYITGPSGAVAWAQLVFNTTDGSQQTGQADYEWLAPTGSPHSVLLQRRNGSSLRSVTDEVVQVDINPATRTATYRGSAPKSAGYVKFRVVTPKGDAALIATEDAWFQVPLDGSAPRQLASAPDLRSLGDVIVLN